MKKIIYSLAIMSVLVGSGATQVYALSPTPYTPIIRAVGPTSATVAVSEAGRVLLQQEEISRTYFEYYETQQVCVMIYPTPPECLPKKTTRGALSVTLSDLKPNTNYTVSYKRDNEIACVTTPCPGNGFQSPTTTFTTSTASTTPIFLRNMRLGHRGADVTALQQILVNKGYLLVNPTGFYGIMTMRAVSQYQRNDMHISPTGTVGPKTRAALNAIQGEGSTEETFTGAITAVSTGCFADGECSVSVDGKKVVTTIGWSQATVGSIRGRITDIGSLENQIGASAKVYAKKTTDGYTLYGNADYYIEVL